MGCRAVRETTGRDGGCLSLLFTLRRLPGQKLVYISNHNNPKRGAGATLSVFAPHHAGTDKSRPSVVRVLEEFFWESNEEVPGTSKE